MPMDNVTLENTQQSISSRDAKSVASVMVNGKWVNLSDTLEQANVKSDVGTVAKQVAAQQEVVSNAASTADSAVAYANDAVEKSLVNSQAIVAQSEAISEAKSAIDSATAEIQQAIANAASDAANIRAGVAQVQNEVDTAEAANSASVEALKSDVSATKQDLADVHDSLTKAQAAAEESQEAIDKSIAQINDSVAATNKDLEGVRNDLTKAQSDITANQKSINDNVSKINSDIEQDRKDIASVQQANADTAKQLDTYSKQAQDQGKTIKSIQDKQDGFTATLADVQGNVTQVSDKVDGLSASLKDAQDNVTSVKAQADQLSATLTDHAKSIATLTASAKELSSTLEDADGRLSKVEQTAQTNSSTLSDVQGDLSQVKQDATTLTSTLKDAQGNISTLQQKADGVSSQLASAQGDIASLQTDVKGIKATLVSHEGDIHTLQADSKTLKDDMQDAQGNISSLQKTATSLNSEISSQDGRLSKVEQTATEHTSTISSLGDKLNNMKIGGRNYLRDSDKSISGWAQDLGTMPNEVLNSLAGETIIVSVDTEWSDFQHSDSKQNRLGFELAVTGSDGKSYWWGAWKSPATPSGKERVSTTFTLPANVTFTVNNNGQNGYVSINGTGIVSHAQVEIGNVSKDWSPAPEDLATVTQVKQTSDSITTTLKNVQGDVDQVTQKANGTSEQLADVKGDVTNIQKDVSGLKQTTADNAGNINTLQSDSKSLHDSIQDVQGNISSLQKTATDVTSELQDHTGRISKVEQTASTLTNEFSDQDGRLSKVEQTATGTQQTVANQQGQINSIQTDVSGIHETITGQGNQITTINATLNGLDTKYEGVSGDLNNLKSQAQWVTVTDTVDLNNIKTPCHEFLKGAVTNAPNETAWWYLTVEGSEGDRITQTVIADQSNNRYTRRLADSWSAWVRDATQTDVTALSNSITTNSTQITQNKQAIDLKADQSTVDKLSGEVSQNTAQLKVQADQISSKVSSSDFNTLNDKVNGAISSIQKNSTAIDQTNKQISLKADQTEVDQVKQTATQNSSRLDVMDGKISSKVTSTDVNNIVDSKGFATTNTVQSLITQTAGTISESITKLEQTVKQGAENNVQLVRKSDFEDGDKGDWGAQTVVTTDPPAELGQSGMKVLQTNSRDAYEDDVWYSVKPGENFDVDFWCKPSTTCYSQLGLMFDDKDYNILVWTGIGTDQSGQWKHYTGTITAPANASFAKPWFQMGKDGSNTTDTALLAKPSIRRQNATTVAAIQQVTASIDGLQSNVTNLKNDTSSQITQLSNLIATKVSSGDYNSQISQLKDAINLRVTKGDVISQINQEAGGNTLIQVSNGKGSLALNAANTVITGKAWIPVAAIADLTADQIQAGTLKGVKVDFRDSTGTGMIADGSTLTFDVSNTPAGYLSYNGMPVAELPDGSGGNELAIRYGLSTAIIPADNSGAQATFSKAAQKIAYMTGTSQGKQMLSGLEVHSNNHHWLCAVNSDATCNRFEVNDRDGLNIAWHDNTHFFISDGNAKLYQDNNDSQTATKLEIHGWAWVNGWVEAAGHSQHSTLSSKTRIEEADPNHMLDLVNNTELTTFAFKSEVAEGTEARHIGPIIDDVNDVAQYRMPAEFIAPTKTARDDDNMIGALFGAVQALTKRIKALESKVG
ncbi:gp58-like family protein [Limosilactobacillus fermentum]|uniref:gp58-like family protein n=1 Tax=Limosilactobacillus fermentum TaxID=1613 RepID=UPI003DA0A217